MGGGMSKQQILTIFLTSIQLCGLHAAQSIGVKGRALSAAKAALKASTAYVNAHPYKTLAAAALSGFTLGYASQLRYRLKRYDREYVQHKQAYDKALQERDDILKQWKTMEQKGTMNPEEATLLATKLSEKNNVLEKQDDALKKAKARKELANNVTFNEFLRQLCKNMRIGPHSAWREMLKIGFALSSCWSAGSSYHQLSEHARNFTLTPASAWPITKQLLLSQPKYIMISALIATCAQVLSRPPIQIGRIFIPPYVGVFDQWIAERDRLANGVV